MLYRNKPFVFIAYKKEEEEEEEEEEEAQKGERKKEEAEREQELISSFIKELNANVDFKKNGIVLLCKDAQRLKLIEEKLRNKFLL